MSHFPDTGRVWFLGQFTIASSLGDIDTKTQKTINGVTGDAGIAGDISTPTTPIVVTGAGLSLLSPPAWASAPFYNRQVSALRFYQDRGLTYKWEVDTGIVVATAPSQILWVPLSQELIDGATIVDVTAYFGVPTSKPSLPSTSGKYPAMQLLRLNTATGILEGVPLSGSNVFPTTGSPPANVTAYKHGGVPNSFTITPSGAGGTAIVDLANYVYVIEYQDDDVDGVGIGSAFWNSMLGFKVRYTSNDQGPA